MRRFTIAVGIYAALCLVVIVGIILHGDGPHPRVVAILPHPGDRFFPGGLVEITFSQPMNEYSVERGLQVSPGGQGQAAWYGNTFNMQPVNDWRQNRTYHVRLVGQITDTLGRPLKTPISFWFHVHRVTRLARCRSGGLRTLCDVSGRAPRPLFHLTVAEFSLSPDTSLLAFTVPDRLGVTHLYLDRLGLSPPRPINRGDNYADSFPHWIPGDSAALYYTRRKVTTTNGQVRLGPPRSWTVAADGSGNSPL